MTILAVCTDYDPPTHQMSAFAEVVIKKAKSIGYTVHTVKGEKATPEQVHSRLQKKKPNFVFFNGHGTPTELHGHNHEPIITIQTAGLLNDTLVFARACDALKELGDLATENNAGCFIGYSRKFIAARIGTQETRPLTDEVGSEILNCSNVVALELLKGRSAKEAVATSREHSAKVLVKLLGSDDPLKSAAIWCLSNNVRALGIKGNENYTLKRP